MDQPLSPTTSPPSLSKRPNREFHCSVLYALPKIPLSSHVILIIDPQTHLTERGTSFVLSFIFFQMSAILEVKGLAYAKGDGQPVISGVTFSVNEGDVVVLRGVSGSG